MSALHGLILLYEKQFQIAALRNTEGERTGVRNLSTSLTPTGWIHVSIEPAEVETSFETEAKSSIHQTHNSPHNPLHSDESPPVAFSGSSEDHLIDSLPQKNLTTNFIGACSPSSLSTVSGKTFYTHVWKSMIFLASDPNPEVASMAQHIVHSVHDKVCPCTV